MTKNAFLNTKNIILNCSLFFGLIFAQICTASNHEEPLSVYLPGMNGSIAAVNDCVESDDKIGDFKKSCYVHNGLMPQTSCHVTTLKSDTIDLGQGYCIQDFDTKLQQLQKNKPVKKLFLGGSSQGTATIMNWLGQQAEVGQLNGKFAGVFLESVLATGNSAIEHTIECGIGSELRLPIARILAMYFPASRVLIPLLAKIIRFPFYNPWWGKSALTSAAHIKKADFPILIMHHENDPQLPLDGARLLYAALKKNNDHVYLFEVENKGGHWAHLNIIDAQDAVTKQKMLAAIQQIYKNHNLPYREELLSAGSEPDLKQYQPDRKDILKKVYQNSWKRRWIRNAIDVTSVSLIFWMVWNYKIKRML